jgi:DNA recombination protein RmuC
MGTSASISTLLAIVLVALVLALVEFIRRLLKQSEAAQTDQNRFQNEKTTLEREVSTLQERVRALLRNEETLSASCELLQQTVDTERQERISLQVKLNAANEKLEQQHEAFELLQKKSILEFESVANKLLRKNSEDFTLLNHQKMNELIHPLKEKIQTFEKKVEDTYEKGLKDQTDLRAELKKLHDLNQQISSEAHNLTRALKGDVKQQGNWGELVLEKVLERSGLTEGLEYSREVQTLNAEGRIIRPDVIINLPDKKHLIVDSKLSLVAYERYVNAEDEESVNRFVREHLISVKSHVKGLHQKHYSSSPAFNSPDFVLLFIPIESSFRVAVEHDQDLFNFAWNHHVVLVSPSTLLATLRTISSVWQQENQTRNALEIARQGGALYDKFVGFIDDLEKIGKQIDQLQRTYTDASKKLYTGSGNLVRRVEQLKELGASTSKQIPDKFKDEQ